MPQPMHLDPSACAVDGGPVGALLIHGYGGSAAETRPMGEFLTAEGWTVRCPLLSGHGTKPEDLIGIRWKVWVDEVESAFHELQSRCETVFVCGISLGSLLALWLGAEHPEIAGLVLMSPAMKIKNPLLPLTPGLRYLVKYAPSWALEGGSLRDPEAIDRLWCYDKLPIWGGAEFYLLQRQVRKVLTGIRQPILLFQGRLDNWLSAQAPQVVYDGVASTDKAVVWMERSGHQVLVDGEREVVWAQSYEWMMRVLDLTPKAPSERAGN